MAGLVGTVYMGIARGSALVALRNNMIGNPLAPAVVEHKVFAQKLVFQFLFPHLARIFYDTPFQLVHILKAFVLIIGTGLFTADPSRTVLHYILALLMFGKVSFYDIQGIPKSIHIRGYGIFKMSYFALIVVAHIYQHGILGLDQFVKFLRIYMYSPIRNIKGPIIQTIGHNLFSHL